MTRSAILILLLAGQFAPADVAEPKIGWVWSPDGTLETISGVAAGMVRGARIAERVANSAYTGDFGLIKLETSLRLADGTEFDAPAGPAVIGFDAGGNSAYVWFSSASSFAKVTVDGLVWLRVNVAAIDGDVIAVHAATLFVKRPDGIHEVRIRESDGAIAWDAYLGLDTPAAVVLKDGTLVYAAGHALIARDAAGAERRIEFEGVIRSLLLMGDGWVQVVADDSALKALRVTPDILRLYEVPEAAQ